MRLGPSARYLFGAVLAVLIIALAISIWQESAAGIAVFIVGIVLLLLLFAYRASIQWQMPGRWRHR